MASTKRITKNTRATEPVDGECLADECHKPAKTRGLCASCYQQAYIYFKNDAKKEKELIDNGLLLPRRRAYNPEGSPFTKALKKRQKK